MFRPGQEPIPGYRLNCPLGSGGCGVVWEASRSDGSVVALKFLDCRNQPSLLVSTEIRTLLKMRELRHPNIIRLHDVIALNQYIVLSMDRADGNLSELDDAYAQETGKAIPCDHLLELMEQAAEGLDFLAEQSRCGLTTNGHGMQHCDVKPANLLVLEDSLKIADFGLCMRSLSGTHNKRFMGTPPYAAPELFEGRVTTHTDQYSLAVTYCELVSHGRMLYPREIACQPGVVPVDFKKVRSNELTVLSRALDPNWAGRWPNCRSFVRALRDCQQSSRGPVKKIGSRQVGARLGR